MDDDYSLLDAYKRCHECLVKLPHELTKCTECGSTVGPADKRGIAKKPINWVGYILTIATFVGLYFFIKWAF